MWTQLYSLATVADEPMDVYPLPELQDSVESAKRSSTPGNWLGYLRLARRDSIHVGSINQADRNCAGRSRSRLGVRRVYG